MALVCDRLREACHPGMGRAAVVAADQTDLPIVSNPIVSKVGAMRSSTPSWHLVYVPLFG